MVYFAFTNRRPLRRPQCCPAPSKSFVRHHCPPDRDRHAGASSAHGVAAELQDLDQRVIDRPAHSLFDAGEGMLPPMSIPSSSMLLCSHSCFRLSPDRPASLVPRRSGMLLCSRSRVRFSRALRSGISPHQHVVAQVQVIQAGGEHRPRPTDRDPVQGVAVQPQELQARQAAQVRYLAAKRRCCR